MNAKLTTVILVLGLLLTLRSYGEDAGQYESLVPVGPVGNTGYTVEYRAVDDNEEVFQPAEELFHERTNDQLKDGMEGWGEVKAGCVIFVMNRNLGKEGWMPTGLSFPGRNRTMYYRMWPVGFERKGDEPPPYVVQYFTFAENEFYGLVDDEWRDNVARATVDGTKLPEGRGAEMYAEVFMRHFSLRFRSENRIIPTGMLLPNLCHMYYVVIPRRK